jgi:hypothetical protein
MGALIRDECDDVRVGFDVWDCSSRACVLMKLEQLHSVVLLVHESRGIGGRDDMGESFCTYGPLFIIYCTRNHTKSKRLEQLEHTIPGESLKHLKHWLDLLSDTKRSEVIRKIRVDGLGLILLDCGGRRD